MRLTGRSGLALFLIACGGLILLSKLGDGFGGLASLLIPILLVVFGLVGIYNGKKTVGGIMLTLGAIILLGQFSGLLGSLFAVAIIAYGIYLLRRKSSRAY